MISLRVKHLFHHTGFFKTSDNLYNGDQLARQNAFGLSNINSAVNSFQQLIAALPKPVILNRNPPFQFPSCKDADGKSGICTNANVCTKYGGSPSGPCLIGNVCCVSKLRIIIEITNRILCFNCMLLSLHLFC